MREGSRIAVHHPNQSAVVRNYKIRILIPLQEARQMLQSILHLPMDHHAALAGEITGENNVRLALGNRGCNLQKKRSDRKSSRPLVGRIFVLIARWVVEFLASSMNEHGI